LEVPTVVGGTTDEPGDRRPRWSSTLVAVVPPVVGVEPTVVPIPAVVGVEPTVVPVPANVLVVLSSAASTPCSCSTSAACSRWTSEELVVEGEVGRSGDEVAAQAPPAVMTPATAKAASAGVIRGRGMWSS